MTNVVIGQPTIGCSSMGCGSLSCCCSPWRPWQAWPLYYPQPIWYYSPPHSTSDGCKPPPNWQRDQVVK